MKNKKAETKECPFCGCKVKISPGTFGIAKGGIDVKLYFFDCCNKKCNAMMAFTVRSEAAAIKKFNARIPVFGTTRGDGEIHHTNMPGGDWIPTVMPMVGTVEINGNVIKGVKKVVTNLPKNFGQLTTKNTKKKKGKIKC
jgi:hypothetical protein